MFPSCAANFTNPIAAVTAVLTVVAAVIFMAAERIPYMPGMQCNRPLCHDIFQFVHILKGQVDWAILKQAGLK